MLRGSQERGEAERALAVMPSVTRSQKTVGDPGEPERSLGLKSSVIRPGRAKIAAISIITGACTQETCLSLSKPCSPPTTRSALCHVTLLYSPSRTVLYTTSLAFSLSICIRLSHQ